MYLGLGKKQDQGEEQVMYKEDEFDRSIEEENLEEWNLGSSLGQQNMMHMMRPQLIDLIERDQERHEGTQNLAQRISLEPADVNQSAISTPNNDQNEKNNPKEAIGRHQILSGSIIGEQQKAQAHMRNSTNVGSFINPPQVTPNHFPSKESRFQQQNSSSNVQPGQQQKQTIESIIRQNFNVGQQLSYRWINQSSFNQARASGVGLPQNQIYQNQAVNKFPDYNKVVLQRGNPEQVIPSSGNRQSQPQVLSNRKTTGQLQQPKLIRTFLGHKSHKNLVSPNRATEGNNNKSKGNITNSSIKKVDITPLNQLHTQSKLHGSGIQPQNLSFTSVQKSNQQIHYPQSYQKGTQQTGQFLHHRGSNHNQSSITLSNPNFILNKNSPNHSSMLSLGGHQTRPQPPNILTNSELIQRQRSSGKTPKQNTSYAALATERRAQERERSGSNAHNNSVGHIGFLSQAIKKQQAPVSKIDLVTTNESQQWEELINTLEQAGIQIEDKISYQKGDLVEILIQIDSNILSDLKSQLKKEKSKNQELKEKVKTHEKQQNIINDKQLYAQNALQEVRKIYSQHEDILKKMQECESELKQTMLNSLMCLDFYKDLESYISENRFHTQSQEVLKHFSGIDALIHQHGLNSLDFDTERISILIESIQDYVRANQIEKKVLEINLDSGEQQNRKQSPKSQEGVQVEGIKLKITKLNKQPFNMGNVPTTLNQQYNSANQSFVQNSCEVDQSQNNLDHSSEQKCDNKRSGSYANRHVNGQCHHHNHHQKQSETNVSGFQVPVKNITHQEEIKVKNAIINRLREQLEHKMKKILELKNLLRQERDDQHHQIKSHQYKEALIKLEKEMNIVQVKNSKLSLEIKQIRKDCDDSNLALVKVKSACKELQRDNEELRKVLKGTEGFQILQDTVAQVSGIMISKKNEQLNHAQRHQMRSIFGGYAIIHRMRFKLFEYEEKIKNLSGILTQLYKLSNQQQEVIEHVFGIIQNTYCYLIDDQVEIEQIRALYKKEWRTQESLNNFKKVEIDERSQYLKEMRKLIQQQNLQEQIFDDREVEEQLKLDLTAFKDSDQSNKNLQITTNNKSLDYSIKEPASCKEGGARDKIQFALGDPSWKDSRQESLYEQRMYNNFMMIPQLIGSVNSQFGETSSLKEHSDMKNSNQRRLGEELLDIDLLRDDIEGDYMQEEKLPNTEKDGSNKSKNTPNDLLIKRQIEQILNPKDIDRGASTFNNRRNEHGNISQRLLNERSTQSFSQPPIRRPDDKQKPGKECIIRNTEGFYGGGEDIISKISRANQDETSELQSVTRLGSGNDDRITAGGLQVPKTSKKILREKLRKLKIRNADLMSTVKLLQIQVAECRQPPLSSSKLKQYEIFPQNAPTDIKLHHNHHLCLLDDDEVVRLDTKNDTSNNICHSQTQDCNSQINQGIQIQRYEPAKNLAPVNKMDFDRTDALMIGEYNSGFLVNQDLYYMLQMQAETIENILGRQDISLGRTD